MERFWWIFLMVALFELGLILILWLKPNKKRKLNSSDDSSSGCNQTVVKLMKIYRHDWLNHMQVVLGYLSLKKYDKIKDYMDRVNAIVKQDSTISNFNNMNLAAFLYLLPVNYPKLDIHVDIEPNLNEVANRLDENQLLYYLKGLTEIFANQKEEQSQNHPLYISMIRHAHLDGIIMTIEYEGDISPFYNNILGLIEQLDKKHIHFSIDLHTDAEFIMELQFTANEFETGGV